MGKIIEKPMMNFDSTAKVNNQPKPKKKLDLHTCTFNAYPTS